MNHDMKDLRKSYEKYTLTEEEAGLDPIAFFKVWFLLAQNEKQEEPNAMFLATVDPSGQPSGRVVLLKEILDGDFVFLTNYDSKKGKDLETNPKAALTFFWQSQERQIRIQGSVSKVETSYAKEYFTKRPRVSQLGALASNQSSIVPNRNSLEVKFAELERKYQGQDVPMPEKWGGYRLKPNLIEFWQGRQGRLHDRLEYKLIDHVWTRNRLSP